LQFAKVPDHICFSEYPRDIVEQGKVIGESLSIISLATVCLQCGHLMYQAATRLATLENSHSSQQVKICYDSGSIVIICVKPMFVLLRALLAHTSQRVYVHNCNSVKHDGLKNCAWVG
jgi:hypothetical protein